MQTETIAYVNGQFVPISECKIHVDDRGFRINDVVFDVERTFNGRIFRLEDHLKRFSRSLKFIRLDPGITMEQFGHLILEVVKQNEPQREYWGDYHITEFVTRGITTRVTEKVRPTIVIFPRPIPFARYAPMYETGVRLTIVKTRSYPNASLDPRIKHYSRLNFVLAELEAADSDPESFPLMMDLQGNISETPTSNFWIVTDGVLRTAKDRGVLGGISRNTIFDIAKKLGIPTLKEDMLPYDVYNADEAFLSSTGICVMPVARIDNRRIGNQIPGPITQSILVEWSKMIGLDIVEQYRTMAKKMEEPLTPSVKV